MGLDMYLEKAKKQEGKSFSLVVEELGKLPYREWKEKRIEIMYWRKANQSTHGL
jgi:predicted CopG family antitoxin